MSLFAPVFSLVALTAHFITAAATKLLRRLLTLPLPERPAQLVESHYGPSWHSAWILLPQSAPTAHTSAADLKSLTHSRQDRVQGLQIESGTRIIDLLVPMTFRSS